jgi:3-phenylpropionate/trans-cinnamate dioxygenase ferredoxin reductase subunit
VPADPVYAIVGGGQAAGWAAVTLRKEGFAGRLVLVGEEPYPPYERPPLSKGLLAGDEGPEKAFLHPPSHYRDIGVELRLGVRALAIDPRERRVSLADGESLAYDKLLLATGSKVRRLGIPGADLPGVHYLRTIGDMLAIRGRLSAGARLAVVGGGYIGLEVAATARKRGCGVVVLEMQETVMGRVVAPEVGRFYADVHRRHGVDVRTGVTVAGFEGDGRVERVRLVGGEAVPCDAVVIGVGIAPDADLAEAAGLAVDNGIVVDEFGRTSDARVFAAGDATNQPNAVLGRRLRLESWQNAQNQAIAAAKAMCGKPEPYAEVPWFWSDQYDLNLQIVGLAERWDSLVFRGGPEAAPFTAFYLADGRVVAANAVNNARDVRFARKLIAERRPVEPAKLADPSMPLKQLA